MRAATVEPVFAQVKQQMGFRRWTVRGLDKVRTQWSLLATTWNLTVMLRHWRGEAPGACAKPRTPTPPSGRPGLFSFACASRALRSLDPSPLAAAA
ncbi:MAG: transposase [Verrucomicrobiota bacterium]